MTYDDEEDLKTKAKLRSNDKTREALKDAGLIAGGVALEKAMTEVPDNQVPSYVPETGYFLGFALILAGLAKAIKDIFR